MGSMTSMFLWALIGADDVCVSHLQAKGQYHHLRTSHYVLRRLQCKQLQKEDSSPTAALVFVPWRHVRQVWL